jgi:hypothetical protein
MGDVTHVLLEDGPASQLESIEFVPGAAGAPGTYQLWSARPAPAASSSAG